MAPVWAGNSAKFVNAQRLTAKAAGIKWKGNGRRHSCASYWVAETGDPARVAQLLGNSAPVVGKHYKQLAPARRGGTVVCHQTLIAEQLKGYGRVLFRDNLLHPQNLNKLLKRHVALPECPTFFLANFHLVWNIAMRQLA